MLQGQVWIKRLATEANIEIETSRSLWDAFVTQLHQRMLSDYCIDLGKLGYWYTDLVDEHIASLENGTRYLAPPKLLLRIEALEPSELTTIALIEMNQALEASTGILLDVVNRWLSVIEPLTMQLLRLKHDVAWIGIGILRGAPEGYTIELESSFSEGLNKSFSMFAPEKLSDSLPIGSLRVEQYRDLGDLTASRSTIYYFLSELVLLPSDSSTFATSSEDEPILETAIQLPAEATSTTCTIDPKASKQAIRVSESCMGNSQTPDNTPTEIANIDTLLVSQSDEPQTDDHAPQTSSMIDTATQMAKEVRITQRWGWLLWPLITLCILSFIAWIFINHQQNTQQEELLHSVPLPIEQVAPPPTPKITPEDSLAVMLEAKVRSSEASQEQHLAKPSEPQTEDIAPPKAKEATKHKSREREKYDTPAEDIVINTDESLAQIAMRKYGHRAFWVYIYEENRELLPDPHNVPIGTKLRLPSARKYGIDVNNTKSLEQALVLQRSLTN